MERLSKRLDDVDETETALKAADEKAEKAKEDADKEDKEKAAVAKDNEDEKSEDSEKTAKSEEMEDIITSEYLSWLESTVKSAGYDPSAARGHFEEEGVEKAYLQEGAHGYDHRGQGSIEGAGEDDSGKRPKMNMGSAPSGNKTVIKTDEFITPDMVSQTQIEEAYQVYKAAALEQQFKTDLGNDFSIRLNKELETQRSHEERANFDARGPLQDLQKAVLNLADRIENIGTPGEDFQKSEDTTTVTIPETTEMAALSWDDVHRLAHSALRGDN